MDWVTEQIESMPPRARKMLAKIVRHAYRTAKKERKAVARMCRLTLRGL